MTSASPDQTRRDPLVRADGLVKTFGAGRAARRVLDDAAIEIGRGELVAIVGRSGSGKSTLLNLLGGIDRAEAGRIEVAGRRVDEMRERELTRFRRETVGFVFQFFHLIGELTGVENVLMPGRLTGNGSERRGRELLRRFGVEEVATRLPHTLSGGEQQRIAIARALVNEPDLLLADEPTGNLDPEAGGVVLDSLRSVASGGRSVLLATHDTEAAAIADRVVRLDSGRLSG